MTSEEAGGYDADTYNKAAEFLPADDFDDAPAIDLGGATVLVFFESDQKHPALGIEVILDDLDPKLLEAAGGELPITVRCDGRLTTHFEAKLLPGE